MRRPTFSVGPRLQRFVVVAESYAREVGVVEWNTARRRTAWILWPMRRLSPTVTRIRLAWPRRAAAAAEKDR